MDRAGLILGAILVTPCTKSYAHCTEAAPGLLWSYPADHDTDIPLDVSVQLLAARPLEGNWSAELNGQELSTDRLTQLRLDRKLEPDGETQVYPLGDLEPDTDYSFRLIPEDKSTLQPAIALSFHTGAAEHTPAAMAPRVLGSTVTVEFPKITPRCIALFMHNSCEERVGSFRSLQLDQSQAIAVLVNRLDEHAELWPVDCTPIFDATVANDVSSCFQLVTVNARGEHSEVTQYCPESGPDSAHPSANGKASCATTLVAGQQSTSWPSALFALVALIAWRRRRLA